MKLENVHVVVSGDITISGKKDQFEIVRKFIDELYEIGVAKVILSPGNHDLDRDSVSSSHRMNFENLVVGFPEAELKIESLFKNEVDRMQLKNAMTNYYNFIQEIGQDSSDYLYSNYTCEIEETAVNFLSFNSSYLYAKNNEKAPHNEYYGYIGRTQIERATAEAQFASVAKRKRAFNICIFHHPFNAMPQAIVSDTEDLLKKRCNLILTGHVHRLQVSVDLTAQSLGPDYYLNYPLISSARCVYDEENDPFTQPGYSIFIMELNKGILSDAIDVYEIGFDKNSQKWFSVSGNKPFTIDFQSNTIIKKLKEFGYSSFSPTLRNSSLSPQAVLEDKSVESIDFMGIFASKWLIPENLKILKNFLSKDTNRARFLLLDTEGKAFYEFNKSRKGMLSTDALKLHEELIREYSNYQVRLFNDLPKYRMLILNNNVIGFSIHELDYENYIQKRSEWDSSVLVLERVGEKITLFDLFLDYFNNVWSKSKILNVGGSG